MTDGGSIEQWHDVALGNPGQGDHNTIALTGVDVVIPVERDAHGDPLQDDEVRIRSEDGAFDRSLTVDDPRVEETKSGLLLYRFTDVPPGVYRVWICVGGRWNEAMRGLVVGRKAVHHQGRALKEEAPSIQVGPPPMPEIEEEEEDEDDDGAIEHLEILDDVVSEEA